MAKMGKRFLELGLAAVVIFALVSSGYWLGYRAGSVMNPPTGLQGVINGAPSASTTADFSTFWEAWQTINDNYLRNESTTNTEKVQGAINGLVGSLGDPYSEYFTPEGSQQFQENIAGNFGGVGAQLGTATSGQVVIIAPLKGTPADIAGLKAGDAIIAINGTSTAGMSVDDAVNLIRGEAGTSVTLSILRSGWEKPRDFKIMRAKIAVPNVELEMKGGIAHITLAEFTEDANVLFYQALVKALTANAKGIVLDLRDDPGGYLEVAVNLTGYFLKPGSVVVQEVGRTVPEQTFRATGDGALANFPLVILVNKGSASAAEILAGALHDNRHIPLVGETTFGKGTVQELEPLSDGSSIKLTVAHWVLPSGRILDHDGIVPDYPVTISDSDLTQGRDPQLDKAIEVLNAELK